MTIHITIQVAADNRGDAIRLIRDVAQRVKSGQFGREEQFCAGAFRFTLVDDDLDVEGSRLPLTMPAPSAPETAGTREPDHECGQ